MEKIKKCFKCHQIKKISLFYKHKETSDGFLNKCKCCTKKDVKARYHDPLKLPLIKKYDKTRETTEHRKKQKIKYQKQHRQNNPGRYRARMLVASKIKTGELKKGVCEICGNCKVHAHHSDYRKPLDVRWLCVQHHHNEHNKK